MPLPASCLRAVSLVTSALKGQVESRINTPFHLTFKLEEELTAEFHQGYMMENGISGLRCDTDTFATFEGDTVVMLQVVGQELLAQYTKQYEEKPLFGLLQNWAESVGDKLRTSFLAFNMDTVDDLAFLLKAVKIRERVLQWGLVTRIYYKVVD
ncbi:acyl-coenzyme A oxidase-like protein isoform X2 [Papio anubis]|uniref:acyl-coenzyme A oxidase-like protein isoform X2 n=1 Tax=Papio anubis TaxID=9555 RepID=UPI000B7B973D|nr:acyl-coenzyme A oxidase-like protein isoform X2 [Papio anubis]